jgi:hypothetical protein
VPGRSSCNTLADSEDENERSFNEPLTTLLPLLPLPTATCNMATAEQEMIAALKAENAALKAASSAPVPSTVNYVMPPSAKPAAGTAPKKASAAKKPTPPTAKKPAATAPKRRGITGACEPAKKQKGSNFGGTGDATGVLKSSWLERDLLSKVKEGARGRVFIRSDYMIVHEDQETEERGNRMVPDDGCRDFAGGRRQKDLDVH